MNESSFLGDPSFLKDALGKTQFCTSPERLDDHDFTDMAQFEMSLDFLLSAYLRGTDQDLDIAKSIIDRTEEVDDEKLPKQEPFTEEDFY